MHYSFGCSILSHFSIDFAPQMKTRCLTAKERACIVGMHHGGAKGVEIVVALGHPKSIVSTILKEFECHGSMEHPKSTEYPQKLLERSIRVISCALVQDRKQTLVDITNKKMASM
jgi:hypothetical protein